MPSLQTKLPLLLDIGLTLPPFVKLPQRQQ
ncbi:hypothetical protein AQB9606_03095 [Aquabacterium sp. CECT 9606]|nr:hypothetical protein AQB9606_03095 [Aquabacterium sp. CECT 9606]